MGLEAEIWSYWGPDKRSMQKLEEMMGHRNRMSLLIVAVMYFARVSGRASSQFIEKVSGNEFPRCSLLPCQFILSQTRFWALRNGFNSQHQFILPPPLRSAYSCIHFLHSSRVCQH